MASPYDTDWQHIRTRALERDGHECQLRLPGCTGRATHGDHIVPLSEGGRRLDIDNVRASCEHCNLRRNATRQAALAAHALTTPAPGTPSRPW